MVWARSVRDLVGSRSDPGGSSRFWRGLVVVTSLIGASASILLISTLLELPGQQRAASDSVANALEVLGATSTLDARLQETVSEARGYVTSLLTDERTRVNAGVIKVDAALGALRRLTSHNPRQQDALARLQPLIVARVAVLNQVMDLAQAKDEPGLQGIVQSRVGAKLMDQCSTIIGGIRAEETRLLLQRQDASDRATRRLVTNLILCTILAVASASLGVLILLWRRIERRSFSALQRLNDILEIRVEERTAELAASHARQRGYFANSPIGMVVMRVREDGQFVLEDLNPAAQMIFDFPAGTTPGRLPTELWPEMVARDKQKKMQACASTRLPVVYSVSREIAGETRNLDIVLTPILDAARDTSVVMLCVNDVTKQRELERQAVLHAERLAEAAELEMAIFLNSPDSLAVIRVVDEEGGPAFLYEEFSPAHETVTGLRSQDMMGRRPEACLPAAIAADVISRYRECVEKRATITFTASNDTPVGPRQCEASVTPVPDPITGRIVRLIEIKRDVTERNHVEEVLRHTQKMEAIGRLSAGVAHDFNNILQAVIGSLELVMEEAEEGSSTEEYANVAVNAAMRGASLTHQLLSYARKQALRPQVVALGPLMADLRDLLTRTLNPNITVTVRVDEAPSMLVDPGELQSALLNLAINASHAMPDGGSLSMEARVMNEIEPPWALVSVTDTGSGMDAATLAQAVEPFFTTKGLEGSGLGLSMVQGFVEQSGGEFHITSAPGEGTTVELRMPSVAAVINQDAELRPALPLGGCRVLLVDDSLDVRLVTGAFLRKAGFTVSGAENGVEALALLDAGERFDVLITDYAMPGMNGVELIGKARGLQPGLPAVIITGYANLATTEALTKRTILLHKPFTREQLTEALRRIVDEESAARHVSVPTGVGRETLTPEQFEGTLS